MLTRLFPSLANSKLIKCINWFFSSYVYVAIMAVLTATCCIFGFEIYAFYAFVACGCIIPSLLCKDMKGILAPLAFAYASISLKSNNSAEGAILFDGKWTHLFILVGLIVVFVFGRLIFDLITNKERRQYKHYLLPGYIAFGITLVFAGILSPNFTLKDMGFGLVEFAALFGVYFLLMYLIDWKHTKKDYLLWLMFFYGVALSAEVIVITILNKGEGIQTGWGCSNNIAGQLCMCIAAPVYLALKKKWIYPVFLMSGFTFVVCIALTNSRGGMVTGVSIAIASLVILFIKAKWKKRIFSIVTIAVLFGAFFGFFYGFRDVSEVLFGKLIHTFDNEENFLSLSGRIPLWIEGWHNYASNRAFGTGWYSAPSGGLGNYFSFSFMPPRYHNTFFQLIGGMGTCGLLAYIYHRYQTVKMTFTKPNQEKNFLFLSILGLLISSLLDCHLFNLGPALNYGMILAAIEGINLKDGIKPGRIPKPKFLE